MELTQKQKDWLATINALAQEEIGETEARARLQKLSTNTAEVEEALHLAQGGDDVIEVDDENL